LFRSYERIGVKLVRVYLTSLSQVCFLNGVTSLGASADVRIDRLRNLAATITDIEALNLQKASFYEAKRQAPKPISSQAIDAEKLLSYPCSNSQRGKVLEVTQTRIYLDEEALAFGGSQGSIARTLGKSDRTVRRRLSQSYREKRIMEPVNKKQIIQRVAQGVEFGKLEAIEFPKLFKRSDSVFEYKCNIYEFEDVAPTSCKAVKYFLRRRLARLESRKGEEAIGLVGVRGELMADTLDKVLTCA